MFRFFSKIIARVAIGAIVAGSIAIALYRFVILPPVAFPSPYHLTIEHGQSLFSLSKELVTDGVIRSARVFEIIMLSLGTDKQITEGEYYFDKPTNVVAIALRISGREFGSTKQKVTFPEGFTNVDIANRLRTTFPSFDVNLFLTRAEGKQGYLFPDTYGLFASTKPDSIIATMRNTFDRKIAPLQADITASGRTQEDIIIMASLIEKEAKGKEDRAIVSSILWNRLNIGMPLQVDAPFLYLLGKESKDLTRKDLAMKSPYNTYINKGLPPAPINNPGLDAIVAALYPVESAYLYYLHDTTGAIHYARTYAEHLRNIKKYLQ